MPIPTEYKEIMRELAQATADGRVAWNVVRYGVFVEVSDSVIELWGGEDSETEKSFVTCSLKNPSGGKQGLIRDQPLDTWFVEEGDQDFSFMNNLFHSAKRQGLGIPKKLTALAEALKTKGTIGKNKSESEEDEDYPF